MVESRGDRGELVEAVQVWNPDDWETFVLALLQARHGALTVHKVPATHGGDLGLDYYCPKDGVAYQCYAPTEPLDTATRADRQKKKITSDLKKFETNGVDIGALFLSSAVKHWILVSPIHNSKEVNIHCAKKTIELRKKALPHADPMIEVAIQDLSCFPASHVAAHLSSLSLVELAIPDASEDDVEGWSSGSADLLETARKKLQRRTKNDAELRELLAESVRWFLNGNAILDALRSSAPDLHEKVMAAVTARAQRLMLAGPDGGSAPASILRTELEALVAALKSAAPNLSNQNAEQIAFGTISDWIMRCPLDFPAEHV